MCHTCPYKEIKRSFIDGLKITSETFSIHAKQLAYMLTLKPYPHKDSQAVKNGVALKSLGEKKVVKSKVAAKKLLQ